MNMNPSQCPQCGSDPTFVSKSQQPRVARQQAGRVTVSASQLAGALRDAQSAHHVYEQTLGHPDANWADWYAGYIVSGHAPSLQPVVTTVPQVD